MKRGARIPDLKTLDQLDWNALRRIERPQLDRLGHHSPILTARGQLYRTRLRTTA